jgi:hypothetical protein
MVWSDGGRFFSGEPDIAYTVLVDTYCTTTTRGQYFGAGPVAADPVLVNIWTAGCETVKNEYVPRNTVQGW